MCYLIVLKETIAESSSKNSLDIMKLSFDLVENIDNERSFPRYRRYTEFGCEKKEFLGRGKLMCETDVHLNKNFSLRMKN